MFPPVIPLILLDGVILLLVTFLGFATHATSLAGGRWLTTFLPMLMGWLLAGWLGGLFHPQFNTELRSIWKVLPAAALAAPLAAVLRGLWLQNVVMPVFALVMMAFSALGLLMGRLFWFGVVTRKRG